MKKIHRYSLLMIALVLSVMAVFGCSSGGAPLPSSVEEQPAKEIGQELYGLGPCTTDAQCQAVPWYQVGDCADVAHATCAPDHYCSYPVDHSNSDCHCIVGDERKCAAGGFQTCFQNTGGGDWPTYGSGGCVTSYDNFTGTAPTTTCVDVAHCQDWAGYPECADYDNIFCATTGPNGKECVWARDKSQAGCNCVERQVRDCTKSGGGAGHQTCTKTSASHTSWNTCT